ncbi:hypothetical protein [Cohaesibacter gelatinilyticus]|uniref:Uncharacterized protein n=1 Tax=Cohaesibacter gelatinilyticus TaxID=372072 RepID=A0A285PEB8_9HYPH|nr:hypothetical protein [Cohaesibacter gelatinilyticus]SNZ20069.1 hypothetical protein SAMN06265368_3168 [Cohaesibacter gelatinilyticus]
MRSPETSLEPDCPTYEAFQLTWHGIGLTVRHSPAWYQQQQDGFVTQHIEVISDDRVPLPITETGYRSHFMNGQDALGEFEGDPVAFVNWWLDEAAQSPDWLASRQLSLF